MLSQKNKNNMMYFLGIDGGGSTLRIALVDQTGEIREHFKIGKNANPTSAGFDNLKEAMETIRRRLSLYVQDITCIQISLAGVGAQKQKELMKEIVYETFHCSNIYVYHDAHGSLIANSPEEAAILIICGTGSVLIGKDSSHNFHRAGGWGYLLGDEASGFWLVKTLFQEYLRFWDGTGQNTAAFDLFRKEFEADPRDALYRFYEADMRRQTASLSVELLSMKNELIIQIVEKGILDLKNRMEVLKSKIDEDIKKIIYMGGMFNSPMFLEKFKKIMGEAIPLTMGKQDIEVELALLGRKKTDWRENI